MGLGNWFRDWDWDVGHVNEMECWRRMRIG